MRTSQYTAASKHSQEATNRHAQHYHQRIKWDVQILVSRSWARQRRQEVAVWGLRLTISSQPERQLRSGVSRKVSTIRPTLSAGNCAASWNLGV